MNERIEPRFVDMSEERARPEHPRRGKQELNRNKIQRLVEAVQVEETVAETSAATSPEPVPITDTALPIPAPVPVHQAKPAASPCGCGSKKKAQKSEESLVVNTGETRTLTESARFSTVENNGRLTLSEGAVLTTIDFMNNGEVISDSELEIHAERFISKSGSFSSPTRISLHSESDLVVRNGDFHSPAVSFDCEKTLDVSANSIDGEVSVKAGAVSVGVKSGNLNVVEHICHGDPVYWNEGTGSMSLGDISSSGEDVVIWSNGSDITLRNIDTTGGTGPGRVTIITNASASKPGDDNPFACSDCSAYIPSGGGGGTVHGNDYFNVVAKGSIEIRANIQTPQDSVRLIAGDKIRIDGDIKTSSPSHKNGAVEIRAYKDAGSSTEFVIGGSGQTNGVNGDIDTSTPDVGWGGTTFIFVKNYASGGIKVQDPAALKVGVTGGKAGIIALDATDGAVTIGAGTLSADGASGQPGGLIFIVGDSIVATAGATTITASDEGGFLSSFGHQVILSAASVSYGSSGLTVKANGGHGSNSAGVSAYSKGAYTFSTIWNPPNPHVLVASSSTAFETHDLTIDGSGTLKFEANTLNNGRRGTLVSGQNITFTGGPVTLESNGKWKDDWNGRVSIFANNGHLKFGGGAVTINANGYQNSDGTEVLIYCDTFERTTDSTVAVHCDGDGKGNGGYSFFWAQEEGEDPITLGRSNGTMRMSADGGTSDGNGGRIEIFSETEIVIKDSDDENNPVLSVSPKGSDGDAGYIIVSCSKDINFTESDNEIHADGVGNGRGGTIIMEALTEGSTLSLADNILSAKGGNTGDGGKISLTSNTDLTMQSAKLVVSPGQSDKSNGKGGKIFGKSEAGDIIVVGNMNADGKGKGKGGTINLDANQELNYSTYDFSAKGGNKGDGGEIFLKSGADFSIAGSKTLVDPGQDNDSNGEGGKIKIESGAELTIIGTMNANGKGKGEGGKIRLKSEQTLIAENTAIHADGGCFGHGGKVTFLPKGELLTEGGIVSAESGNGECAGFNALLQTIIQRRGGDLIVIAGDDWTLNQTYNLTGTDGKGGTATIEVFGTFSFGPYSLHADGEGAGDGGVIDIVCRGNLNVQIGKISAKAGSGSQENTKGGVIGIKVLDNHSLSLSGEVNVSGHGSGDGGKITLSAASIDILGAKLHADGGNDGAGGEAGSIDIEPSETAVEMKDLTDLSITAKGGGDKKGGSVSIKRAKSSQGTGDMRVNSIISVDGGYSAMLDKPFGRISLNGTTCQQWKSGFNRWPETFWTTEHLEERPGSSTEEMIMVSTANLLQPFLKWSLKSKNVQLYFMDSVVSHRNFFAGKEETEITDDEKLWVGVSVKESRTSTVFRQGYIGDLIIPNIGLEWTTFHEVGHSLDYIYNWSSSANWVRSVFADVAGNRGINLLFCDDVFLEDTCSEEVKKRGPAVDRNWQIYADRYSYFVDPDLRKLFGINAPRFDEILADIFAAKQNELNKNGNQTQGPFRHPLERTDAQNRGELRKAYQQFGFSMFFITPLIR